jgi:thiol-disulfide isomerase/thioredoxin
MKTISLIALALVTLHCAVCTAAAPPDTLTLQDLVNHPERWPASVTLQRDFKFNSGAVAHQGDKAQIAKFDGSRVYLVAGNNIRFIALPADCALLDAANQAWSALTPAQRAIDPDSLAGDLSLWPLKVKLLTPINCSFGKIPAGTEVDLLKVTSKDLGIAFPNSPNRVAIDFGTTDAIDRARALALIDPDKRPSRIAAALEGIMVDSEGKPYRDEHLNDKKFFAFYFGANWCAPCHAFSPDFVKFCNDAMPKHPELAVVLMSNDEKPAEMLAYMTEEKFPFPAVPLTELNKSTLLSSYAAKMIPHLIVVDRFGKVLASNDDEQGNRGDPKDTIDVLAKLLAGATTQP